MRNTVLLPRRPAAFVVWPMVGMPAEGFVGVFVGFAHDGRARKPVSAEATGSVVGPAAGVAAVQPGGTDNLPIGAARPVLASTDPEKSVGAVV